jgi:hypothetical protein
VSPWLITSLNLPVVIATGRLLRLTLSAVSGHPIELLLGATGLTLVAAGGAAMMTLLRRRALRRASPS